MRYLHLLWLVFLTSCASQSTQQKSFESYWSFFKGFENQKPRGGTTTGPAPKFAKVHPGWQNLTKIQKKNKKAKDRAAILAMAGDFKASVEFFETTGLKSDYKLLKPYQSWGTEWIFPIANEENFISLQHILIMSFLVNGKLQGPMVMKHWRQDWLYEESVKSHYTGMNRFESQDISAEKRKGRWLQKVYQVDDSPRYQVMGSWTHESSVSYWQSDPTWRPLPRREFSVRNDYNILEGDHRITILDSGWIHEQDNAKVKLSETGDKHYLAREFGLNRYRAITDFDTTKGKEYWDKTKFVWSTVREFWEQSFKDYKFIQLRAKVDDKAMWQQLFSLADRSDKLKPSEIQNQVKSIIKSYFAKTKANDKKAS